MLTIETVRHKRRRWEAPSTGKAHNLCGWAIIDATERHRLVNNIWHCVDGPARKERHDDCRFACIEHRFKGNLHRAGGPARIRFSVSGKPVYSWWYHGLEDSSSR